jgi:ABC-type amino acid transport substrate-binding protein
MHQACSQLLAAAHGLFIPSAQIYYRQILGVTGMKTTILAAVTIAAALTFASAAKADGMKLRVATEGAYPPFNSLDASGNLVGFDVDIAKALCQEMKADCSFIAVPWDNIINRLEKNEYDLVVASMSFTEERAKRMEYSASYYRSHSAFAGDPSRFHDISPAALKGFRIAAGSATIQSEYLQKTYPESKIVLTKDEPEAQKLLQAGEVDLVLADSIDLMTFLQSPENSKFDYVGDPVTNGFLKSSAHITAHKGNTELIKKVNDALDQIHLNGTYDRINNIYFPFSIY